MNGLERIFRSAPAHFLRSFNTQTNHLFHTFINKQTSSQNPLRFWHWSKSAPLYLSSFLLSLPIGAALYQEIRTKLDAKKYPPPGRLVDIDGCKMHLHDTGAGGPTVVLVAGLGCNCLLWFLVQPEIAKFTRVVSFDRPGNGWSSESPLPRTSSNIARELRSALQKANIPGPYIVVGHAFGGLSAQFLALDPDIHGLILLNSIHKDQMKHMTIAKLNHPATMLLSHLAIARLATHLSDNRKELSNLPKEIQDQFLSQLCTTKFMRTVLQETSLLPKSCEELNEISSDLGSKPLAVISNLQPPTESDLAEPQKDALHSLFQTLQKDLLSLSKNSKQIFIQSSDNLTPLNQPDIIVASVKEMIDLLKNKKETN